MEGAKNYFEVTHPNSRHVFLKKTIRTISKKKKKKQKQKKCFLKKKKKKKIKKKKKKAKKPNIRFWVHCFAEDSLKSKRHSEINLRKFVG